MEDYWIALPIHLFHKYFITFYILSAVLDGGITRQILPIGRARLHQESLEPETYVFCTPSILNIFLFPCDGLHPSPLPSAFSHMGKKMAADRPQVLHLPALGVGEILPFPQLQI